MNNFDKVYNSILREGKADPTNKKGTKESAPFQKHRNKLESRASSKASRRRGKKEMVEEMLPALAPIAGAIGRGIVSGVASGAVSNMMSNDEDAENSVDYRELFRDLHSAIEEYIIKIDGMYDEFGQEGQVVIDMVEEDLGAILESY
jgi:hypothetical protein